LFVTTPMPDLQEPRALANVSSGKRLAVAVVR
jgi:hypothetical protein